MSLENLLSRPAVNDVETPSVSSKRIFLKADVRRLFPDPHTYLDRFMQSHPHLQGVELIEQLLNHFQFSYQTPWHEKERIPPEGRVVIISNHPLGTLDGAAVFKLVSEVRPDVKVVVHPSTLDAHSEAVSPLASVILPYRAEEGSTSQDASPVSERALDYLQQEGALIFFPCEDVSRIRPGGVIDTKWRHEFLTTALAAGAPILPIFVDASHSAFFYGVSAIYKPLSSLLLVPGMRKQTGKSVSLRVGDLIACDTFSQSRLPIKTRVKLFKKHVYKIGKGKAGIWPTQTAVAHPEPRKPLKKLIASQTHLGQTQDGKQIYLYKNTGSCAVLREIGRLREIAFRAVGEGTGKRRDVDHYDALYSQLVLWDEQDLEIVGAYRLADAGEIIRQHGLSGLYSSSLFEYHPAMLPILQQGAELGRSFVQPRYWGKRSLDYLWYGIGSFLSRNPHIRYLFGPVSLSNDMPKAAKDLMVYFFSLYFGQVRHQAELLKGASCKVPIPLKKLAASRQPYPLSSELVDELKGNFSGEDYQHDFKTLKHILSNMGCSVPTLFKQYSELCEPGGLVFLDFGIDSDFGDCIDGLVMVDVSKIKAKKRARYIPDIPDNHARGSFSAADDSDDEV
jgi:putative hemolysin